MLSINNELVFLRTDPATILKMILTAEAQLGAQCVVIMIEGVLTSSGCLPLHQHVYGPHITSFWECCIREVDFALTPLPQRCGLHGKSSIIYPGMQCRTGLLAVRSPLLLSCSSLSMAADHGALILRCLQDVRSSLPRSWARLIVMLPGSTCECTAAGISSPCWLLFCLCFISALA